MMRVDRLRKRLEELRKVNFRFEDGRLIQRSVFISNKPEGKVVGEFDDYEEAKREARRVARELDLPDGSWMDELEPKAIDPPFYVVVGEVKVWLEEVES
jgi:hypothetical protein